MRFTLHAAIAAALILLSLAIAVPLALGVRSDRAIPTANLSVPIDRVRPLQITADRALGPVVQQHAGIPPGNPFSLRERGKGAVLPVPEPPPPTIQLPEPPLTPYAPAGR
jgi:hypothetical protein